MLKWQGIWAWVTANKVPKSASSLGTPAIKCSPLLSTSDLSSLQACVTQYMSGLINPISFSLYNRKWSPSNDQYPYSDDKQRQMSLWGRAGICNYCLCGYSIIANERVTGPPHWQKSICACSLAWPTADNKSLFFLFFNFSSLHSAVSWRAQPLEAVTPPIMEQSRKKSILLMIMLFCHARPGVTHALPTGVTDTLWLMWEAERWV